MKKPKLVANAKRIHNTWTFRLTAINAVIWSTIHFWPETILSVWNMVTPEARAVLPPFVTTYVPLILMGLTLVARYIQQDKVSKHG